MANYTALELWNSRAPNRVAPNPNRLLPNQVPPPPFNINQYNTMAYGALVDFVYNRLMTSQMTERMWDVNRDPGGIIRCWEPVGPGITHVGPGNYRRLNIANVKTRVHVFMWLYHNPGQTIPRHCEVSHLCGNDFCCRPNHLCVETRQLNLLRRNCPGAIYLAVENLWFDNYCPHFPSCMRVTSVLTPVGTAQTPGRFL